MVMKMLIDIYGQ